MVEITALGVARAAGLAVGINMDQRPTESSTFTVKITTDGVCGVCVRACVRVCVCVHVCVCDAYPPYVERDQQYSRWNKAVKRSLEWEIKDEGQPAPRSLIGPLAVVGGTLAALGSVAAVLLYFKTRK